MSSWQRCSVCLVYAEFSINGQYLHWCQPLQLLPMLLPAFLEFFSLSSNSMRSDSFFLQWEKLFSGCMAGATAILSTYPMETLRTRMALSGGRLSLPGSCKQIWQQQGISGFYQVKSQTIAPSLGTKLKRCLISCRKSSLQQSLIPYIVSPRPGCRYQIDFLSLG